MSENEFKEIDGDSYRGSRYSNFVGGGIDTQGNVSSAATENSANAVGTSIDVTSDAPPTPTSPSQGLTQDAPGTASLVIGAALPYAGKVIGQTAGTALATGASASSAFGQGVSNLANKATGGLLGTASSSTNVALANLGGKAGPATQAGVNAASKAGNIGKLGSGANFGAAAGAGFASAAATLLAGGSIKDAAKSGVGTAVGQAIGSAIGGPIGGFIGGFIGGSLFCFTAGTLILMKDGTQKKVEDLQLLDVVLKGGSVTAVGKALNDEIYEYKNTILSGSHAVFEDGKWLRVEDSYLSKKVDLGYEDYDIVYPVATENNILITQWFISADFAEVPDTYEYNEEDRIDLLNSDNDRNMKLLEIEKEVCCGC